MKIIYIYRSPKMGFSIGKVFKPIEKKMKEKCDCDSITFSNERYNLFSMIKNIRCIRKYMKKNSNAIIHITGTEHYLLPFIKKYKTVCTVHDLGFYTSQKKTLRLLLKFPLWISSLSLADKVTFISEKSYMEARELVKFKNQQTCVILNPVGEEFKPKLKSFNETCPRVLLIGTKSNKNVEHTITALEGINCNLRIVGPLSDKQRLLLEKYNIKYSQVEKISDEQVIKEYQNCDIVSFASKYEGFGMPILEGQASGKVIVTSDISPMREIANGSCVLVNPFEVESIRNGIKKAIKEHSYYEQLGQENVRRFSLNLKSEEYYELYKSLIK